MIDGAANDSAEQQIPEGPQLGVQRIYIKDVSFESPQTPDIFVQDIQPEIEIQLQVGNRQLDTNNWEVEITVNVTAKTQNPDKVIYLVEVKQAGIFYLYQIPDEHMGPALGIQCPNMLFPYAREAVSDLIGKGGFQPLLLAPVNFEGLYFQQLENAQNQDQPLNPVNH